MDSFSYFVLVPMVYFAFGVFFFGTIIKAIKIFTKPKNPIALQIYPEEQPSWFFVLKDTFFLPTVKRHKPVLWLFLMAFHIAFLLLIVGHIELIKKFVIFQIIPHEVFLGKGFIGVNVNPELKY
ncbi:MAG: hypothetical protein HQK76_17920 [Desulfobacterales bacterium]|nr:hypothetical protein [Desulfobacterales bacterium]